MLNNIIYDVIQLSGGQLKTWVSQYIQIRRALCRLISSIIILYFILGIALVLNKCGGYILTCIK